MSDLPESITERDALRVTIALFKEVQAERDRYRKALEWYAAGENIYYGTFGITERPGEGKIGLPFGTIAREALSPETTATKVDE